LLFLHLLLINETNIPKPIDPGEKPSDFVKPMPDIWWVLLSRHRQSQRSRFSSEIWRFSNGETEKTRSLNGLLPTVTRRCDFVGSQWAVGGRNFRRIEASFRQRFLPLPICCYWWILETMLEIREEGKHEQHTHTHTEIEREREHLF
jgi:hypothetical protein